VSSPTAPLVRATLRPYQRDGVAWLRWVDEAGPGGVLADDMGLGKTLQVLEALAQTHARRGTLRALVVTTTSTTHNWRAECEKFTPWLPVAVWAGKDRHRHREAVFRRFSVVVTSYAIAKLDRALLASHAFDWVVLDEAQAIKNAASTAYRVAQGLRGQRRLALTGTPIENAPGDFHAIFDWAVPGILGTREGFETSYGAALAAGDRDAAVRLQRVVSPYLLRRLKTEVATDLPTKTELQRFVELPPVQRAVYDHVRKAAAAALEGVADGTLTAKKRMAIFAVLTKLRQVACDPRLLGIPYAAGGKLRELVRIVAAAKAKNEKVLVFSSFAEMVRLLESDLARFRIGTCTITGETTEREKVIATFQNDPSKTAFLITLKAGGAGLNLTCATTVVHFDPWWNPAAQDQATDRAYRIGQGKPVTVHALLAADTIEERVLATVEKKRTVANLLLGEGSGESLFAHASDLLALLR
jgi:SNF2 family DNA or RNA helicase